jgi:transcriptional antiterminator RfaH
MSTSLKHWYCLRSQPKRERLAASRLPVIEGVEAFLPQVRFCSKAESQRLEPLFPNYLFARFELSQQRAVRYSMGVQYILSQGERLLPVPEHFIKELQSLCTSNADTLDLHEQPLHTGAQVRLIKGIFSGQTGQVQALKPASERIVILLNIMGQKLPVEVPSQDVERAYRNPMAKP